MLNVLLATALALDINGAAIGAASKGPVSDHQEELREAGKLKKYPAKLEALHTAAGVPPVSTTMKCVINLTIQYFLVYTAVAVVRTYNQLSGTPLRALAQTLTAATATVNFAPMLSVLFVGTRMRALQLSQGQPDEYDLPQPFVKIAMQCCADGIPEVKSTPGIIGTLLTVLKWTCMALLYGGFTAVCVGAFAMDPPKELWPEGVPPVSPAVACTMNLAMQYFGVYLAIAVVQTWVQFNKNTAETHKLTAVLQLASNTVNFAPMLCILFIGARMRALQIDPKHGNPQLWAQRCFYLCAYSVLVQTLLVFIVPYLLG